jgi:hypothetical protein
MSAKTKNLDIAILASPQENEAGYVGIFSATGSRVDVRGYFCLHYSLGDRPDYNEKHPTASPHMWVEVSNIIRIDDTGELIGCDLRDDDKTPQRYEHNIINGIPIRGSLYLRASQGGGWYNGSNLYRCDHLFQLGEITDNQRAVVHQIGRELWDLMTPNDWHNAFDVSLQSEQKRLAKYVESLREKIEQAQNMDCTIYAYTFDPRDDQKVELPGYHKYSQ